MDAPVLKGLSCILRCGCKKTTTGFRLVFGTRAGQFVGQNFC